MSTKYIDEKEEDYEESSVDTDSDSEVISKKKKAKTDNDDESILDSDIESSVDLDDEEEEEEEDDEEENGDEFNEDHIMSKDKIVVNKNASGSEPIKMNNNIVGGDSDDDEGSVDDDENYLQKFDESLKQNIISEWHHEDQVHNDEEVETMCTVVRDANGFIIDPLHKTLPFVTKYEKARILGERAKQLDAGAKPFVTLKDNIIDSYLIALKEFEAKKIPFIVRRPLPNGACEYWRLRDLEYLE